MTDLTALTLVLTAACNLRCAYCYQSDKKNRRMDWSVAESALQRLLASRREDLALLFIGGEPLLEFPVIQRAVEYVDHRKPAGKRVQYAISTNGLLVRPEHISFFNRHDFDVQLSFDGVPGAQSIRGAGTFDALDRLINTMRVTVPRLYERRLRISITVTPATVRFLPDSIDYFVRKKQLANILVTPASAPTSDWRPERIEELDAAFSRIFDIVLRHFEVTGSVPLQLFRKEGNSGGRTLEGPAAMCRMGDGHLDELVVDVDGQTHGCVMFVDSYQTFPTMFLRSRAEALQLGHIADTALSARVARFPLVAQSAGIFHNKQLKHSSYRRCADCEFLAQCVVCPMSIGRTPEETDPDRVPDFHCAFNLVSLKYRARFPQAVTIQDVLKGIRSSQQRSETVM